MLLVDVSNIPGSLSEAAVHFIDLLNCLHEAKRPARILIIYSKIDLVNPKQTRQRTISNIKQLLRTSHIKYWYNKSITIREVEYSAVTGQGIEQISYWLNHCYLY